MISGIPHLRVVIAVCIAAIGGYAVFSGWVVFHDKNATMIGDVIGTWKSFAVAGFRVLARQLQRRQGQERDADGHQGDPLSVQGAAPGQEAGRY
jgi:hypothetical protein